MSIRFDGFHPDFLDFKKGIRVGHLEPQQRITQILKLSLEQEYREKFVIDRYGRGVYWQWICFVPKANRALKPVSGQLNFCAAKFFIMIDKEKRLFKSGMQVERGFIEPPAQWPRCQLREDWDWHQLLQNLTPSSRLYRRMKALCRLEGFEVFAGSWEGPRVFATADFPSAAELKACLEQAPPDQWCAFQLYYAMTPDEVRGSSGAELVEAILAIFREITPVMNQCMGIELAGSQR